MHLHSAGTAAKTLLDPSSGSGFTCGWGDAGTREDLLSKFSRQLVVICFFVFLFFYSAPQWDGGGVEGLGTAPPALCPSAHLSQPGRRATWAGSAPAHWLPGAPPPLAVDSSAGAERLVPASRVSAWERVRAPPGCLWPQFPKQRWAPLRSTSRFLLRTALPCARRTVSRRFGHVKSLF